MKNSIASRIHRTLKHLTSYRDILEKSDSVLNYVDTIPLQEDDAIIGIYENFPGEPKESIALSNLGMYVFLNEKWEFIGYRHIDYTEVPSTKQDSEKIIIHMLSGQTMDILIRGAQDKFRDVFEFLHFLDRVVNDVRSQS